ncbi:hypothetical protein ACF3MZ_21995 [Paenibacillaceae bacterium WGS1546]|uniref:hypothetical protein n=1 Tax=Cohnella sp. WGS1546 TaxID=3366810 RepID=UPI00372CF025
MSAVWLQASAAALFLAWIGILRAMHRFKPSPSAERPSPEEAVSEHPGETEETDVMPAYSFSRWEARLAEVEEAGGILVENPRWNEAPAAYERFRALCGEKGIAIVDRNDSGWLTVRPVVYFDDCQLMPLLWGERYRIHLTEGKSLLELLREASPFSIIVISVRDDGSQALSHDWQEKLCEVGIRALTREHLRRSYINIIWKKYGHTYVNLYEEQAEGPLAKRYDPGDRINDFKFPMRLEVGSEGYYAGDSSSIRIDGRQYSPNGRGMNIVVYDMVDSKVQGIYRVDTFVTVYEDRAVYRALPTEGENDASEEG